MFYPVQLSEPKPGEKRICALVILNPSESRRLLAKATVALPEVQNAMKNGMIIIGRGITNAYVTEELLKTKGRIRGDPPFAINQLVNTWVGHHTKHENL